MRREEKSKKSREHILSHAFGEFAAQGYLGTSVNTICARGQISKGLLYHYYADKDTLYLACVERCFQDLTSYLSHHLDTKSVTPDQYFDIRLSFFRDHPLHQRLFCDTAVNPQPHLRDQVSRCRAPFDALNQSMLTAVLQKERLADGVSVPDAIWQLRLLEDSVSTRLRHAEPGTPQAEEYDRLCRQALHAMLYGLIARS